MKKIIENILYSHNNYNLQTFEIDLDFVYLDLKIKSDFSLYPFLESLREIKEIYIDKSDKITSEIEARRIAILVTNCYLKHDGDIYRADLLERRIYENIKFLYLSCSPIPEENRIEEEFFKDRIKSRKMEVLKKKVLRLGIEGKGNKVRLGRCYLTYRIINLLREEIENGESKLKDRGSNQRRTNHKSFQSKQINCCKVENREEITLRKIGESSFLFRTRFYELDSEGKN